MFLKSVSFAVAMSLASVALAADPTPVREEGGKFFDAEDQPTYKILEDGTVDWYTYSGFRMYHAECHVCHGPDAMGSTYAPALKDSLKTMDYYKFMEVVASGQQNQYHTENSVMPAFGDNRNVMCFIDDLYVYLRARADGALDRGRPAKKVARPQESRDFQEECLGS